MTLPGLIVEVALETGPNEIPGGGDWTDLSDRVLAFDMKRGREDRTASFEPGTISLVLDNSDDQLDPLRAGSLVDVAADLGLPMCPIRVKATHETVDYPVFYGFIGPECWVVDRGRASATSTVRLDAFDRLGLFAQIDLPSSVYAAQVQWLRPSWWVRGIGGDVAAGNGDSLRDSSGNGVVGEIAASGSDVIFETASLVDGDSDSAMLHQAGVSGFTDDATLIAARANMTMACIWRGEPDAADQEIMRQRNMTSSHVRWRVECQPSGSIVAIVYNTSGTATDFVAAPSNLAAGSGGRWDDGEPHIIFCRIEGGTRMRLWVDGRRDECVASIPATIAGRVIFGGGSEVAAFDEVAYWDSALTTATINSITDAFTGVAPFTGDTINDRLLRWWQLTDHPEDDGIDTFLIPNVGDPAGGLLHGVNDVPASLAEAFEQTVASFRGTVWCDRSGFMVARDSAAPGDASFVAEYATRIANLTDVPTSPDTPPPVRRSRPEFGGTRLDRIVNISEVTHQGLTFSMRNDASVARYGPRVRAWTCEQESVFDAVGAADDEVNGAGNFAAPTFEMRSVTVWPLIDALAADFVFADLELERLVQVEWTSPSDDIFTTDLHVQGESWSWRSGLNLEVRVALAGITPPVIGASTRGFWFTGAVQTFVVPDGVTAVDVTLRGAGGGSEYDVPAARSKGAKVVTTLAVTPGETLNVYAGGAGGDGTNPTAGAAGWNGGAAGGPGAGGGGGASDIRQGGTALADRVAVAGGGGGAGANGAASGLGGNGGTVGAAGTAGSGGATGGAGGTGAAGGTGGTGAGGNGSNGALGVGGAGATGSTPRAGGGGGGGYYGGGGGGGATLGQQGGGGGGGSSVSTGSGTTITDGDRAGDGYVLISWS